MKRLMVLLVLVMGSECVILAMDQGSSSNKDSDVATNCELNEIRRASLITLMKRNINDVYTSMSSTHIDYGDDTLRTMTFNPDGTKLVVIPGSKVKTFDFGDKGIGVDLYDIRTGKKDTLAWYAGGSPTLYSDIKPCWSPNGDKVMVDYVGFPGLAIWDIHQRKHPTCSLQYREKIEDSLHSVCWSPNGKTIATIDGYKSIVLWSARTGDKKNILRLDSGSQIESPIKVMWNHNDENEIALRFGGTVRLFDINKRKVIKEVDAQEQELKDDIPWMVNASPSQLQQLPCNHISIGCPICMSTVYSSDRSIAARPTKYGESVNLITRVSGKKPVFRKLDRLGGMLKSLEFRSDDTVLIATVYCKYGRKYRLYDLAGGLRTESTSDLLSTLKNIKNNNLLEAIDS